MVRESRQESSDQKRLLDEALRQVKLESAEMKQCLTKERTLDALKYASQMLAELRTSSLSPKYYYHLYTEITHELQRLELALMEEFQKGRGKTDLYETVQYASNIIPRLYLLITVGIALIKLREVSRKEILRDLVEMCCGVQHPLRGLFLRNYLLQCTQNLLPKSLKEGEEEDGTVHDSVDFILSNLAEMNKLWVRMQYQGQSRDQEKRERERHELQILVGTNLVRLAQLEEIDFDYYKNTILPKILVQIVSCKDPIAQEYLMECVIQVFPDEFHVNCLDVLLKTCGDMHERVNIKNVLTALIDRIASYGTAEESSAVRDNDMLFNMLSDQLERIVESRSEMAPEDVVELQVSMVNFGLACYKQRYEFVDKVFASTYAILKPKAAIAFNCPVGKELCKLFRIPIDAYNNVLKLLNLPNYALALSLLDHRGRTKITYHLVTNMLDERTAVTTAEAVEKLLTLLDVLITDQPDQPSGYEESEDFLEEQILVTRMIHMFDSDDRDTLYSILLTSHKFFSKGGKYRNRYTYLPLTFKALILTKAYCAARDEDSEWQDKTVKIFKFIHQVITSLLTETESAALPFRLFLQGALVIDAIPIEKQELLAYEYLSQALAIYEEEISDSRAQLAAIVLIMGTLQKMTCFAEENHEPLRTQCLLAASKLFKKPDQSRAVATCAHLFWCGRIAGSDHAMRDGKRVVECLKKSLKIATQCMDPCVQVQLFTEILNHYICFAEDGCPEVTTVMLNELMAKIREALLKLEPSPDAEQIQRHFDNTVQHLQAKAVDAQSAEQTNVRFAELVL